MYAILVFEGLINDRSTSESANAASDSSTVREFDFIFGLFVFVPIAHVLGDLAYSTRIHNILDSCFSMIKANEHSMNGDSNFGGRGGDGMTSSNKMSVTMIHAMKRRHLGMKMMMRPSSGSSDSNVEFD